MTPKQIDRVVREVKRMRGACPHDSHQDCAACIGRWIHRAIRETLDRPLDAKQKEARRIARHRADHGVFG